MIDMIFILEIPKSNLFFFLNLGVVQITIIHDVVAHASTYIYIYILYTTTLHKNSLSYHDCSTFLDTELKTFSMHELKKDIVVVVGAIQFYLAPFCFSSFSSALDTLPTLAEKD